MTDLRTPIGIFFTLVGIILLITGFVLPEAHAELAPTHVNLWCGLSMLIFGSVMLWLARRAV
jgi:hypothetical protein